MSIKGWRRIINKKELNLLDLSWIVSVYRGRHVKSTELYTMSDLMCYCHDVRGPFGAIGMQHVPEEWKLFIDSSSRSSKVALFLNGNINPSITNNHSVHRKVDYKYVNVLMQKYKWSVCGNF